MLEKLVAPRPIGFESLRGSILSLILHLAIGYAAIKTTTIAATGLKAALQDSTAVFFIPVNPPPPRRAPTGPPAEPIALANPPPLGFQTVVPPPTVPTDIPPLNLNERFSPADFSGKGVEGGVATGVRGGTGPVVQAQAPIAGRVFEQAQVDEPVEVVNVPLPDYPEVLRQAGIQGRLLVRYVVDTIGRAEPASWRVLRSPHAMFAQAAREAILKALFKPARIQGQAVRQLVQQVIAFTLQRADR